MNNSEKDLILMDQILYKGILGTDEWHSMDNDPLVIQDNATLKKVLESLNSTVTHEQMDNLQEAICDYVIPIFPAGAGYRSTTRPCT